MKPKNDTTAFNNNNNVLLYTRVSSKDQFDNFSLANQANAIKRFSIQKNYNILEEFGYTYESASDDMSRKEFQRLLEKVKTMQVKPFAILVYKINRFSRTGGDAIALLTTLINNYRVHLIEASTGISTETERGKIEIYDKLLAARKDNLDRLDITKPGMIEFLKQGNWLGHSPRGYSHYGTRVKDVNLIKGKQEIVINEEGLLLEKAWNLKLQGYTDSSIRQKLDFWGLKINKQSLSALWRNPFYCGISVNSMLPEPVKGNWPQMVTEEEFLKVQKMLNSNHNGYVIDKGNEHRPLMGTILCPHCGKKLSGYEVKKKKVHYYCCPRCKGVCMNASQTVRAKGKGANELFVDLLNGFSIPEKYGPLFRDQLNKLFDAKYNERREEEALLKAKLKEQYKTKDDMEERFAYGKLSKELYDKFSGKLSDEILAIQEEIGISSKKISNQKNKIKNVVLLFQNISKIWVSVPVDAKKRLQKLIFPSGLVLDTGKRKYLTKDYNSFFNLIRCISSDFAVKENGLSSKKTEKSASVARKIKISNQIIDDFIETAEVVEFLIDNNFT